MPRGQSLGRVSDGPVSGTVPRARAYSGTAEPLLEQVAAELRGIFGNDLVEADRGKTLELCERLYPELLAA